jgi:hypothetical protein
MPNNENIVRFRELLLTCKISNQFVMNILAACCDFYRFGWMARHIAGGPRFRHYSTARRAAPSLVGCEEKFEKASV